MGFGVLLAFGGTADGAGLGRNAGCVSPDVVAVYSEVDAVEEVVCAHGSCLEQEAALTAGQRCGAVEGSGAGVIGIGKGGVTGCLFRSNHQETGNRFHSNIYGGILCSGFVQGYVNDQFVGAFCNLAFLHSNIRENDGADADQKKPKSYMVVLMVMLVAFLAAGFLLCGKYGFALIGGLVGYGFDLCRAYKSLEGMNGDISGYALTIGELCAVAVYALL